jgi:superfamily I DNA/RNA helicase
MSPPADAAPGADPASDDGPTPNAAQRELIETTEGVVCVDAGAGTGKTFAITRRYANLLDRSGVDPDDVCLMTFTNNAAEEMTERIVAHCDYDAADLRDAPIGTFHAFCQEVLERHGHEAPRLLGIDDRITRSTTVLDDEVIERDRFQEFLREFRDDHPEYDDRFRVLSDPGSLLGLCKQLAAKGVFPTREGWYRDGEAALEGDREAFEDYLAAANEPNEGANGPTQSDLRSALSGWGRDDCYLPDAPDETALRGEYGSNQADPSFARQAFETDREDLQRFVHDVYFEYVAFAISRNYLDFSLLQGLAFVLLAERHDVREELAFEYVMVDEFQDTSEIQFKLALLLTDETDLCVVGDWKQSIYSFQYAAVENITDFEDRLAEFAADLNGDADRVDVTDESVQRIALTENYRSTQSILDHAEGSLTRPATGSDEVDAAAVESRTVSLTADTDHDHSQLRAFTASDEHEALLDRIQHVVGNPDYAIRDPDADTPAGDGDTPDALRPPRLEDIAVLTRTRRFGREFQAAADDYDVPVAYEGGVELFDTDQAKTLLAWLRILEDRDSGRGWALVLERCGYTLEEVEAFLDPTAPFEHPDFPDALRAFREELAELPTIGAVARRVFDRYAFHDAYADALVDVLESTAADTHRNRGDVVRFLEAGLERGVTHEVDDSPGRDSVTVQTIHAAKGLEHPIVILANVNEHQFPPSGGSADRIRFEEPLGLRQTKRFGDPHGRPHVYDCWRYDLLSACLPTEYDEERRLLYVATTRARDHLLYTAGDAPSGFFEALPLEPEPVDPDPAVHTATETEQATLHFAVPEPSGPVGVSPHHLMDDTVFESVENGRGTAFGTRVHEFAEDYARDRSVEPTCDDERRVCDFLDGLDGEMRAEERVYLPCEVDGERVTLTGVADLVCVDSETVHVVDYKTDLGRHGEAEYRKQLSVYYHVLREVYPDREVSAALFYTSEGLRVDVDPLSRSAIRDLVADSRAESA